MNNALSLIILLIVFFVIITFVKKIIFAIMSKGKYKNIKLSEAIELYKNNKNIGLIDVRSYQEVQYSGYIKNSVNIALDDSNFNNKMSKLDKDKEYVMNDIYNIIKNRFNLDIPIFVITSSELEDVLKNSPKWWETSNKETYDNLIFIMPPTKYEEVYNVIGEPKADIEQIMEYNNSIFWTFDLKNYRKSIWWVKTVSTSIKDKITIRTANTMKKILELCAK